MTLGKLFNCLCLGLLISKIGTVIECSDWKRGGGNEKLEVVGKRQGERGDKKERKQKWGGSKLMRKGRRYRGGSRRDKGSVTNTSLGVSLQAKIFLQGMVSGFGGRALLHITADPHISTIREDSSMINICAGPILLIVYISVHQMNILETSFSTSNFFS